MLRVALDAGGRHLVEITADGAAVTVALAEPLGDLRSLLHEAIARELVVRGDGVEAVVDHGRATFSPAPHRLEIAVGRGGPDVAVVAVRGDAIELVSRSPLSPFETRFLADNGRCHPSLAEAAAGPTASPRTDLHTHFAGCVSARDLLAIGAAHGAVFRRDALLEMGVSAASDAPVAIASLPDAVLELVARRLSIPADRQETFANLELVYARRAAITKHAPSLPAMCRAIARDYASMGVAYAELSLFNVVEAAALTTLHRELPAIERETGVTLRFLAALSRHDDLEWDLDVLNRLKDIARSRYLVGVDFMGHETNSTRAFLPQLEAIARWASEGRPGFVVRVHAGENPGHPENVRVALDATEGLDVELRIGHGLYGADDQTLERLARRGVVVEFNLGSNYALNNVQSGREVPLVRYLARGVPVVLGTDGYGIYETTPALEARTARLFGATDADLARILETEAAYVARRRARDELVTDDPTRFEVPPERPPTHYGPEVAARAARARAERDAALEARLAELGARRLELEGLERLAHRRLVLAIGGAWQRSFAALDELDRARIELLIASLFDELDRGEVVVVAGGTSHGVEGLAQRAARARGFDVVAAITASTPPDALDPAITHAMVVAETLYDKASRLYPLLRALDAACVFIGGGPIVSDEIQTAENLRARTHLFPGVGASGLHAAQQSELAFTSAAELVARLRSPPRREEPYRYLGANPTVDVVVVRATGRREVLLVRRDADAPSEAGKWALPGGFVLSDAPHGGAWAPGKEAIEAAALRELCEETSVDLRAREASLVPVGIFERGGRDPRDSPSAWSRSHAFAIALHGADVPAFVAGGDDACDARWFPVDEAPQLAFDHAAILSAAMLALFG